jgi:O-acetyl-ADP-ribose deacetylase (regulator of RNase III)
VITTAGRLLARHVIHTVGPGYSGRPEVAALLAACHTNSLELAVRESIRTIAFPAISTGVYGYPVELAAPIALGATIAHLEAHAGAHDEVRFVLFGAATLAAFVAALGVVAPRPG